MSIKIVKTVEAAIGTFADVPVNVRHNDGRTMIDFGMASVSPADVKSLVGRINEVLKAIAEPTI